MNSTFKWIWVVLWTAFIVYALLSPSDGIPLYPWMDFEGFDKLVHAVLFGIEAFLLGQALNVERVITSAMLVLLACVVLGGALEIVQFYFVEGRNGDLYDLIADAVGAFLGLGYAYFLKARIV